MWKEIVKSRQEKDGKTWAMMMGDFNGHRKA